MKFYLLATSSLFIFICFGSNFVNNFFKNLKKILFRPIIMSLTVSRKRKKRSKVTMVTERQRRRKKNKLKREILDEVNNSAAKNEENSQELLKNPINTTNNVGIVDQNKSNTHLNSPEEVFEKPIDTTNDVRIIDQNKSNTHLNSPKEVFENPIKTTNDGRIMDQNKSNTSPELDKKTETQTHCSKRNSRHAATKPSKRSSRSAARAANEKICNTIKSIVSNKPHTSYLPYTPGSIGIEMDCEEDNLSDAQSEYFLKECMELNDLVKRLQTLSSEGVKIIIEEEDKDTILHPYTRHTRHSILEYSTTCHIRINAATDRSRFEKILISKLFLNV